MNNLIDGTSPAFPVIAPEYGPIMTGLTKRELFAAMAMQGFISSETSPKTFDIISERSVKMADSLLERLELQSKPK